MIEVSEGSEAANVDIVLGRALQTFSVTGRVIDGEKGLPVPNLRFGVQRVVGARVEFVNMMTNSNSQGDFIIEALIPGKYSVFAWPSAGSEMRTETLTFDIFDQDISGLTIKVSKGASVSGLVVFETEDKSVLAKLSEMQVRGFVTSSTGTSRNGFLSNVTDRPRWGVSSRMVYPLETLTSWWVPKTARFHQRDSPWCESSAMASPPHVPLKLKKGNKQQVFAWFLLTETRLFAG